MTDDTTSDRFTFEHDGETYTFEHGFETIRTPGWLRANRRRDELDLTFTIIEATAGDEALEAIDKMTEDEFVTFGKALDKAIGASPGK